MFIKLAESEKYCATVMPYSLHHTKSGLKMEKK